MSNSSNQELFPPTVSPETLETPLSPERRAARAFDEAFRRCSSDNPAADERAFDSMIGNAVGSSFHPEIRQAYQIAGGILRWQMFGTEAELPPGLLWTREASGITVTTDPRLLGDRTDHDYIAWSLCNFGLDDFFAHRAETRMRHQDELLGSFTQLLGYTPVGRLLLAHAHAEPSTSQEQPLPEHIRLARENALWTPEGPNARHDPVIRSRLRKPIGRLSFHTIDAPHQLDRTPLERLRLDLNERVVRFLKEVRGVQSEGPLHIDTRGSLTMQTDHGSQGGHDFAEALHRDDTPLQPYSQAMLYAEYKLMEAIFAAPRSASPEQILAVVARDMLCVPQGLRPTMQADEHTLGVDHTGYLRGVQGEIVPKDAMPFRQIDPLYLKLTSRTTQLPNEETMQMLESHTIGEVENYHLTEGQGCRIILHERKGYREIEGPDGDISVLLNRFADFTPFVPGYEVVSMRREGDNRRYELRYTGEDPYVYCSVPMPEAGIRRITSVLSTFKLDTLVTALESQKDLTVSEFIAIMQANFVPHKNNRQKEFRRDGGLSQILRQCVQNGQVYLQCQQAGAIIQESLCIAFGSRCAQILFGHALPMAGGAIHDLQHDQVAVCLEGRLYILDATPDMPHVTVSPDAAAPIIRAKDIPPADPIPEAAALAAMLQQKEQDGRADEAERVLYEHLRVFFGAATNEAVHRRMHALRRRDAAAETIGCLLDLRAHGKQRTNVDHTLAMLEAATEAHRRTDSHGSGRYSGFMLASMRYALETARGSTH